MVSNISNIKCGTYNAPLAITVCHHSASLVMPICDPRDKFFYPTLTLVIRLIEKVLLGTHTICFVLLFIDPDKEILFA